jgi:hypothetical protein
MLETKVLDPALERTVVGVGVVGMGTVIVEVEVGDLQEVVMEVWVVWWLVVVGGGVVVPGMRQTLVLELTVIVLKATCGTVTV